MSWRALTLAMFVGVGVSLLTGFMENRPGGVTIPESKYFGFPLVWRINDQFTSDNYRYPELLIDCVFWVVVTVVVAVLVSAARGRNKKIS